MEVLQTITCLIINHHSCTDRITSLTFKDILPEDPKLYDKMRPPKKDGSPTVVHFHVTVMGLDSIDENAMVILLYVICDLFNYAKGNCDCIRCSGKHVLL